MIHVFLLGNLGIVGSQICSLPTGKSSKPRPRNENEEEHGPEAGYIWMLKGELLERSTHSKCHRDPLKRWPNHMGQCRQVWGGGTGKDIIRSSSLSSMICTVRLERHPNTSELVDWTGRSPHLQVNQYEISSWSMTIHT